MTFNSLNATTANAIWNPQYANASSGGADPAGDGFSPKQLSQIEGILESMFGGGGNFGGVNGSGPFGGTNAGGTNAGDPLGGLTGQEGPSNEDVQSASGALAAFMHENGIKKLDPGKLYELAEDPPAGTPQTVSQAAKFMLQNPDIYKKIETHDVQGADGKSGVENFDWAAEGGPSGSGLLTTPNDLNGFPGLSALGLYGFNAPKLDTPDGSSDFNNIYPA
jgi:hypothetical protein